MADLAPEDAAAKASADEAVVRENENAKAVETGTYFEVKAKQSVRWRTGRKFTPEAVMIALDDLDPDQLAQLAQDTALSVACVAKDGTRMPIDGDSDTDQIKAFLQSG